MNKKGRLQVDEINFCLKTVVDVIRKEGNCKSKNNSNCMNCPINELVCIFYRREDSPVRKQKAIEYLIKTYGKKKAKELLVEELI